jgi:ABC-type oligopeptide transport system substrate-binding subunit
VTPRSVNALHALLRAAPARLLCVLLLCGWFGLPHAEQAAGAWVHAYAAFGEPKYPSNFSHFDYVNPNAPKGGAIHLRNPDRRTSFDKFNYFTIRGNAPAGMAIFMLEPLTVLGADEPRTMYGLLAQEMRIEPDLSAITFRLNPLARFSNGDAVTAADVKYSFDSLSGKYASPTYSSTLVGVRQATVLDERTIRFELADRSSDTLFKLGALPVFSHKWGLKPDGTHARFDEIVSEVRLLPADPIHYRRRGFGAATGIQAQPELLGARPAGAARLLQLRARGVPLLPGRSRRHRGLQGRRIRPGARLRA